MTLKYRPGVKNGNADMLSRLPLPDGGPTGEEWDVFTQNIDGAERSPGTTQAPQRPDFTARWVTVIESGMLSASAVADATRADPEMSVGFVQNGCPKKSPPSLEKYWAKRLELYIERDCLMWGDRVVVP